MATKQLTSRQILALADDTGEPSKKDFDETLTQSGFSDLTPGRRIQLAAAASDQALTFTAGSFVKIYSHDNGFKIRLAADETLSGLIRHFCIEAQNATNAALTTSVLLTGNGSTVADLEVWIVEKYTP